LQHRLVKDLHSIPFLINKLVTACQSIPTCQFAISDPPSELGPLINKIQSSITAYKKQNPDQTQAYYTDRRYYKKGINQSRYNRRNRQDLYQPNFPPQYKPRCFVCNKEEYKLWNHSLEEIEESKARFKATNKGNFNKFDNCFNKHLSQYIAKYKDNIDIDSEEEIEEAFQLLAIETSLSCTTSTDENNTSQFYTSFG
jgi:hypothetical protein